MEKTEEILITKKVVHRYCDDCGKELNWALACSARVCRFCKKQLCIDCIGHEREGGGDYHEVYCKTCSGIYQKHKQNIDDADRVARLAFTIMRKECEDQRNV